MTWNRLSCILTAVLLLNARALLAQQPPATPAPARQVGCKPDVEALSPAELAYHRGKLTEAASLFATELGQTPGDERLQAGQIRTDLALGKLSDATRRVDAWTLNQPASGAALTARAELLLRSGDLPDAYREAAHAQKLAPCNGRAYYVLGEYEDMSALFLTEKKHMDLAHALSPVDPEITMAWINLQPKAAAKTAVTSFVETSPVLTEASRALARKALAKSTDSQASECRLSSAQQETTVPFSAIQYSPDVPPAYGLEMSFNGKKRRLELDTGASGLTLTAGAAERLGLVTEDTILMGGMGDDGVQKARVTHVANLRFGDLEFTNCTVSILPPRNMEAASYGIMPFMGNIDGLVGADLFSNFLVTLDYPGAVMKLSALPALPGAQTSAINLQTSTARRGRMPGTDAPLHDRSRSSDMGDWTPFYRILHYLLIPTQLNDGPVKLMMADTGAEQNIISPVAARAVTKVSTTNKISMVGLSGETKQNYLTDKIVLHFAQLYLPLPWMVSLDTTNVSNSAGVEVSGFLGFPALRQMTLQIDYRDNLIHFVYDPKRSVNSRFQSTPFTQ